MTPDALFVWLGLWCALVALAEVILDAIRKD